jgi:hypothetical protein
MQYGEGREGFHYFGEYKSFKMVSWKREGKGVSLFDTSCKKKLCLGMGGQWA